MIENIPQITLFRLDHRQVRDQRITSHVALTARALGCNSFIYSGDYDRNMEQSLSDVAKRWGGSFNIQYSRKIKKLIKEFNGVIVHLSMYGEPHTDTVLTLKDGEIDNLMIIVGGAKVPPYIYELSDFNTAIGWQPHSEVAATAIFLYSYLGNDPLYYHYEDATISLDGTGYKSRRSERFSR